MLSREPAGKCVNVSPGQVLLFLNASREAVFTVTINPFEMLSRDLVRVAKLPPWPRGTLIPTLPFHGQYGAHLDTNAHREEPISTILCCDERDAPREKSVFGSE